MYRILHVIDSLGYGGTEHQMVLNISGVQGKQFENYVCYLHDPNDLELSLAQLGVPVYKLGVNGKPQWVQGVMRLRKLIKSLNIDLVHTKLFDSDVIGGIAGRLSRRPVISTLANPCFEPEHLVDNPSMNSVKLESSRFIRSIIAHTCNFHLISVSQTVSDSAQRRLKVPPEKISVIYRALAKSKLAPPDAKRTQHPRDELGLSRCSPVLLNVGRLVPQKGQIYLVEAMATVVQQLPQARLLIAGDGHLKPTLVRLRDRLGLQDQVTFLGHRNDVKELLEVADIFVFPSLYEGCPNALIEAMAAGKPCVASKIGAIEEVMEDGVNGVLVSVRSPKTLASAIIELTSLGDVETARMGQRAKVLARRKFTVRAAVEKLGNMYHKVLEDYYGPSYEPSHASAVDN